jgi:Double zinc ribbon
MRQQEDWYAYLNLSADTPTEQVEQAVERLSRQAAALAVTAPERSQQLRDTVRAIKRDLLSGPDGRARYDAGLIAQAPAGQPPAAQPPAAQPVGGERIGSRIARFLRTGWTCSSCGKEALPSAKFCTRCGTPITPTRHDGATVSTRAACAGCAAPLGANDAFCARCGTAVRT